MLSARIIFAKLSKINIAAKGRGNEEGACIAAGDEDEGREEIGREYVFGSQRMACVFGRASGGLREGFGESTCF